MRASSVGMWGDGVRDMVCYLNGWAYASLTEVLFKFSVMVVSL